MKLVVNLWVKNESQLIELFLNRASEWADEVVALDNGSTDGTYEILSCHPLVKRLFRDKPGTPVVEKRIRNLLLDAARERKADWVMIIDADEILDRRFSDARVELMRQRNVAFYNFLEISLWRSHRYYRVDKPEMYMRREGTCKLVPLNSQLRWDYVHSFSWRDSFGILRRGRFPNRATRTVASQLYGLNGNPEYLLDLVRLHYHFVDRERAWRNHLRYALYEAIEKKKKLKDIPEIIEYAARRLDEKGLRLARVKPEWQTLPMRNTSGQIWDDTFEKFVDNSFDHEKYVETLSNMP